MKQVKNKRNLLIMFVLLLVLCLAGCGLFKSDTQKLKDLLEDKYGEKFGVESYYYAGDMWSMCYPLSDPTLLFEVRTDGAVTFIGHDYYLQNVVARQVEEEYESIVEQAFPGSYLSVDISHTLSSIPETFPKADTVTLDDITQYCEGMGQSSYIVMNIFVDISQIGDENIEMEYSLFKDEIGDAVANEELPDVIIKLYFGDTDFVHECETIIISTTWMKSDIYKETEGCPQLWMGYDNNSEFVYTIDEYIEKREEALSNE